MACSLSLIYIFSSYWFMWFSLLWKKKINVLVYFPYMLFNYYLMSSCHVLFGGEKNLLSIYIIVAALTNSVSIKTVPKCLLLTCKISFFMLVWKVSWVVGRYLNIMWDLEQIFNFEKGSIAWNFLAPLYTVN